MKLQDSKNKIYPIDSTIYKDDDSEMQTDEYSSESLIYDDDSTADVYNLILKPKLNKGLKNDHEQRNSPILYVLNTKIQNDLQKLSDAESYVLERKNPNVHSEEESETFNNSTNTARDDTGSMAEDVTSQDESITINPSPMKNSEAVEENSKTDENQKNVDNHRARRDVGEMNSILIKKLPLSPYEKEQMTRSKRYDYLNLNNDLSTDKSVENSKRFSKLLKSPNLIESIFNNPRKKSLLPFDTRFTKNHRIIDKDLSKKVIPFSKNIDLMESLEHILFDDSVYFKSKENESSINEREIHVMSEKHSVELDKEVLNNEINHENEDFNVNRDTNGWLKMLPLMIQKNNREHGQLQDTQRIDSNSNNYEVYYNIFKLIFSIN